MPNKPMKILPAQCPLHQEAADQNTNFTVIRVDDANTDKSVRKIRDCLMQSSWNSCGCGVNKICPATPGKETVS